MTIKFERLEKLQKNNWVDDKPEPVKKVVKVRGSRVLNVKQKQVQNNMGDCDLDGKSGFQLDAGHDLSLGCRWFL